MQWPSRSPLSVQPGHGRAQISPMQKVDSWLERIDVTIVANVKQKATNAGRINDLLQGASFYHWPSLRQIQAHQCVQFSHQSNWG